MDYLDCIIRFQGSSPVSQLREELLVLDLHVLLCTGWESREGGVWEGWGGRERASRSWKVMNTCVKQSGKKGHILMGILLIVKIWERSLWDSWVQEGGGERGNVKIEVTKKENQGNGKVKRVYFFNASGQCWHRRREGGRKRGEMKDLWLCKPTWVVSWSHVLGRWGLFAGWICHSLSSHTADSWPPVSSLSSHSETRSDTCCLNDLS